MRAAQTSASRRAEGGVVPAWLSWPDDARVPPDLRLRAGDDADRLALAFEDRALLDVELEIGVRGKGRRGVRAARADAVQRRRRP